MISKDNYFKICTRHTRLLLPRFNLTLYTLYFFLFCIFLCKLFKMIKKRLQLYIFYTKRQLCSHVHVLLILCITFKMKAYLITTVFATLYVRVGILLARAMHLHDCIFHYEGLALVKLVLTPSYVSRCLFQAR